jgi:hypothetical protein
MKYLQTISLFIPHKPTWSVHLVRVSIKAQGPVRLMGAVGVIWFAGSLEGLMSEMCLLVSIGVGSGNNNLAFLPVLASLLDGLRRLFMGLIGLLRSLPRRTAI